MAMLKNQLVFLPVILLESTFRRRSFFRTGLCCCWNTKKDLGSVTAGVFRAPSARPSCRIHVAWAGAAGIPWSLKLDGTGWNCGYPNWSFMGWATIKLTMVLWDKWLFWDPWLIMTMVCGYTQTVICYTLRTGTWPSRNSWGKPSYNMVDLSTSFFKRLPEGNVAAS